MEHHHDTSRRPDDRRAWAVGAVVMALLAVTFGGVFLAVREGGPAGSGSPIPSLPPRPTSAASTTAPTTVVPATLPRLTAPPAPPRPAGEPDEAPPEPTGPREPRPALRELADELGASEVSDVVPIGSSRFAVLVRSGGAELYRWTGSEWNRDEVVRGPASISDVATVDVTGDGIRDFLLTLGGVRPAGGVFGRSTSGFELLPFNTNEGQEEWLDDLHLELDGLVSDVTLDSGRIAVEWTWTGRQFEVLG